MLTTSTRPLHLQSISLKNLDVDCSTTKLTEKKGFVGEDITCAKLSGGALQDGNMVGLERPFLRRRQKQENNTIFRPQYSMVGSKSLCAYTSSWLFFWLSSRETCKGEKNSSNS